MSGRLKEKIRRLRRDTQALYLACRHPRTPWYVKALLALLLLYALSPIDLIPDFIPVLGYLDDLLIVVGGFSLAVRLIPAEVLRECREQAGAEMPAAGSSRILAAVAVIAIWLLVVFGIIRLVMEIFF